MATVESSREADGGSGSNSTKKWSKIHQYFTLDEGNKNYICNICSKKYAKLSSSSTGNIHNHMKSAHPTEFAAINSQPSVSGNKRRRENPEEPFNREIFLNKLQKFLVGTDQPYSIVEDSSFQELLDYVSKDKEVSRLPGRTSMIEKVSKAYLDKKAEIKEEILRSGSKVSIVVDGWTSSNQIAFQGVIARFVNEDYQLKTIPLDLTELNGPHTGENMAHELVQVLEDYNLLDRIQSITTDNASSMDTMLTHVSEELASRGISFDKNHQRVRCLAHILNLSAKDLIRKASVKVGLKKFRDGIEAIRATPKRRKAYLRYFDSSQTSGILPILDCDHRWGSTFNMIDRALSCRKEITLMLRGNPDLAHLALSTSEWKKLEVLKNALGPLYEATQIISVQRTPNIAEATMIYQQLFVHFDQLIKGEASSYAVPIELSADSETSQSDDALRGMETDSSSIDPSSEGNDAVDFENSEKSWLQEAAKAGKDKLEKYYPDTGGKSFAIGIILHPAYKLTWFKNCKWPQRWINSYREMFEDEWKSYNAMIGGPPCPKNKQSKDFFSSLYQKQMKRSIPKRDIEKYLHEPVADKDEVETVGLLKWWQVREVEYPILSKMARNSLSVSGSGVPVESFFSTGTDVLTSNRQRLTPQHVKELMCLKRWNKM